MVAPSQLARFTDVAIRLDLYLVSPYREDAITFGQIIGVLASLAGVAISFIPTGRSPHRLRNGFRSSGL